MTDLLKPVKRMARTADQDYVVTLYPGGVIGIREKGRRREFTTTIGSCYISAVRQALAAEKKPARRPQVKRGLLRLGGGA